jgi:hypothetical protein
LPLKILPLKPIVCRREQIITWNSKESLRVKEALLLCKKAAAALKCVSAAVSQHHNVGFQVLFFRDPRRSFRLRAQYAGPQHGGRTSRSALEKSRGARDDLNWLAWSKIREENGKM